jgi:hypothetical protein
MVRVHNVSTLWTNSKYKKITVNTVYNREPLETPVGFPEVSGYENL